MIPGISAAVSSLGGGEWSVGGLGGLGGDGSLGGASGAGQAGSQSFGGALSNAVTSLEQTQSNATSAALGLATGTLSDPTQAVTAVENASLSMDLAAQVQNKLLADTNTIFQTQI